MKPVSKHNPALVIGTGRSGTSYVAAYLRKIGLHVEHESYDTLKNTSKFSGEVLVSWRWATLGLPAGPFGVDDREVPKFGAILHAVRHPLTTIGSWQTAQVTSFNLVNACLFGQTNKKLDPHKDKVLLAMYHWLHWNQLCERIADYTWRVEDTTVPVIHVGIMKALNLAPEKYSLIPELGKELNTRKRSRHYKTFEWSDLQNHNEPLTEKIKNLALDYGYSV